MDFLKEYVKLKEQGFPKVDTMYFRNALGKSSEMATHFELYCTDEDGLGQESRANLGITFSDHGKAGGGYLLSRLSDEDTIASHAAYLLAFPSVQKVCKFSTDENVVIIQKIVKLSESANPQIRRRSIIAIGWIGTSEEITLLTGHLLTDEDTLCRAWAASSFLQMAERERLELQTKTKEALIECLNTEKDAFVKGVAIEAIMEVWNVSFGLRTSAVESRDYASVERAAGKALKFLEQME